MVNKMVKLRWFAGNEHKATKKEAEQLAEKIRKDNVFRYVRVVEKKPKKIIREFEFGTPIKYYWVKVGE